MRNGNALAAVTRKDRLNVLVALVGMAALAALAWAYMVHLAMQMDHMGSMSATARAWGLVDVGFACVMWAVMMVAMMIPTAAPMVLVFTRANRKRSAQRPLVSTGSFILGYSLIWIGFAVLATLGQWGLHAGALMSSSMGHVSPVLAGAILVAAGVFQWTPLKHACLRRCRSPLGFLISEWRSGTRGALVMGMRHGTFCAGCCWALMALMFVGGVMNLLWMVAITAYVLAEKVVPGGRWFSGLTGVVLTAWGSAILLGAV